MALAIAGANLSYAARLLADATDQSATPTASPAAEAAPPHRNATNASRAGGHRGHRADQHAGGAAGQIAARAGRRCAQGDDAPNPFDRFQPGSPRWRCLRLPTVPVATVPVPFLAPPPSA
uniref:Uncharacterized protein n=1 Tax=Oryza brachyantha TaxID=4533 RepID=J3LZN6_ORYBR